MTATLIEQINNLNDADSVGFLQYFNQMLVNGVTSDFDELLASIPPAIRELPQFNRIEDLSSGETQHNLTEQDSIELAKQILEILRQNAALVPLLDQAWETWNPNNSLGGSTPANILSVAIGACMIIVVAATEVNGNVGGVEIHKHLVSIEDVAKLIGQFGKIINGSPAK